MLILEKPITYQEFKAVEFDEQELKECFFELINEECDKTTLLLSINLLVCTFL